MFEDNEPSKDQLSPETADAVRDIIKHGAFAVAHTHTYTLYNTHKQAREKDVGQDVHKKLLLFKT